MFPTSTKNASHPHSGAHAVKAPVTSRRFLPVTALLLGLLLGSAAVGGTATYPASPASPTVELSAEDILRLISAPGRPAPVASLTATSYPVSSCADAGPGSLRSVIAGASDGDTVSMAGLACRVITLDNPIEVPQDNLIVEGRPDHPADDPFTTIDGQELVQIFRHSGTGILQLKDLQLIRGSILPYAAPLDLGAARGGCVRSAGSVALFNSVARECTAQDVSAQPAHSARGGAIYAVDSVGMSGSTVELARVVSRESNASGGGIWAGRGLVLMDSVLDNNLAESMEESARGGGAFVGKQLIIGSSIVRDNRTQADNGASAGGGILLDGELAAPNMQSIISGAQFIYNSAETSFGIPRGEGGGLLIAHETSAAVLIGKSHFRNNSARLEGGGILSHAPLIIISSLLAFNTASKGAGLVTRGLTHITHSTIARNEGGSGAGAILGTGLTAADPRVIRVTESTISSNVAYSATSGAGLVLMHDAEIWNSTITGNFEYGASSTGAGVTLGDGVQLQLESSIVAGNRWGPSAAETPSDIGSLTSNQGTVSGSHNLLGELDNVVASLAVGFEHINDPELAPLANNGGPTVTHLPKVTSLAIDAGADNGYSEDQRGEAYPRVVGPQADIGAVELDSDRIFRDSFDDHLIIVL